MEKAQLAATLLEDGNIDVCSKGETNDLETLAIGAAAIVVAHLTARFLADGESPESAFEGIVADFREEFWKQYEQQKALFADEEK